MHISYFCKVKLAFAVWENGDEVKSIMQAKFPREFLGTAEWDFLSKILWVNSDPNIYNLHIIILKHIQAGLNSFLSLLGRAEYLLVSSLRWDEDLLFWLPGCSVDKEACLFIPTIFSVLVYSARFWPSFKQNLPFFVVHSLALCPDLKIRAESTVFWDEIWSKM